MYDAVLKQLSSARVAFPGQVDVLVLLGASLEALGRLDEAAAIYEEAMALAPENEALKESRDRALEKLSFRRPRRDR
jgi:tetratricopeptide (TPR) repeat protein